MSLSQVKAKSCKGKESSWRYNWDLTAKGVNPDRKCQVHQTSREWTLGQLPSPVKTEGYRFSWREAGWIIGCRPKWVRRNRMNSIYNGTWNVLTLSKPVKLQELAEQMVNTQLEIAAIWEKRWSGNGLIKRKNYSWSYSGSNEMDQTGTGSIVMKKAWNYILGFEPYSEWICKLTLSLLMSYIYRRTFDNADSYLFLFPARCVNTEWMQKGFLCLICS